MEHLILLHGAIGSAAELKPLHNLLMDQYVVHSLNFPGHGGTETDQPFSLQLFADHVLSFMNTNQVSKAHIFGYSMGGYVGIYLAAHHPEKIMSVTTLGTKFYWDEPTAKSAKMDPAMIEEKVPAFAKKLSSIHREENWKTVLKKTAAFLLTLGKENPLGGETFNKLKTPCLFLIGDRDTIASLEETIEFYKRQPNAGLAVIPFMGHALDKADLSLLSNYIRSFAIQENV